MTNAAAPRRIAVIGSGISGLAAAWLLARDHQVTLYEANTHAGGHTHTVDVTLDGVTAPVDTGFLVFNERTYPNLIALFKHLGVRSVASDMSFSVRIENENLEWAGSSLATVFAQRRNLARSEFWLMLRDILRFNREAGNMAHDAAALDVALGEFLADRRYGRAFRDWYLLPMSSAIWSCPPASMLHYPLRTFIDFCRNHGLLQLAGRPQWRTVVGGGRDYVRRMLRRIPDVRLGCAVTQVTRHARGVAVRGSEGGVALFDEVILACHGDQALRLLGDADAAERQVLSAFRYQPNRAVLHTDQSFLPRVRKAWSAWNYHSDGDAAGTSVGVSYLINHLQPLPFLRPVIVTLNPRRDPAPGAFIDAYDYEHPVFDRASIAAQQALGSIQGRRRTWFCGAWTGYGFHEDGLRSGMVVAASLGVTAPWAARPEHAFACSGRAAA